MTNLMLCLSASFFLAACAVPEDSRLGSDSISDKSAKTVSESELNNNGCSFLNVKGEVRLFCEEVETVELLFAQKMSVINYEKSIRSWLQSVDMSAERGHSVNKRTWHTLNNKYTLVYVLIRNRNEPNPLAFQEYASLQVARVEDMKERREGLEFLLKLALEVGSIATLKDNKIQFKCSECNTNWKAQVASSLNEFETDAPKNSFNTYVASYIRRVIAQ